MRHIAVRWFGLAALALLLAACSGTPAAPAAPGTGGAQPASAGTPVPTSAPGTSTVTGQLLSTRTGAALPGRIVRLGMVIDQDIGGGDRLFTFNDVSSPSTRADEQGTFVIANVPAGEYVMVVANDLGDQLVITTPEGKAQVWKADADKVLNVGVMRVDFP